MIRLENLTKHYGSFVAVDDISLDIPQGVLYGCLGPNGAGKTTTLRMIAGILRPTNGRVLLGGDDVHANPIPAKMRLGFIPDRPFVYDKLTGSSSCASWRRCMARKATRSSGASPSCSTCSS